MTANLQVQEDESAVVLYMARELSNEKWRLAVWRGDVGASIERRCRRRGCAAGAGGQGEGKVGLGGGRAGGELLRGWTGRFLAAPPARGAAPCRSVSLRDCRRRPSATSSGRRVLSSAASLASVRGARLPPSPPRPLRIAHDFGCRQGRMATREDAGAPSAMSGSRRHAIRYQSCEGTRSRSSEQTSCA